MHLVELNRIFRWIYFVYCWHMLWTMDYLIAGQTKKQCHSYSQFIVQLNQILEIPSTKLHWQLKKPTIIKKLKEKLFWSTLFTLQCILYSNRGLFPIKTKFQYYLHFKFYFKLSLLSFIIFLNSFFFQIS